MSTRISSLSIRTTLPSTTSPCLKLLMSRVLLGEELLHRRRLGAEVARGAGSGSSSGSSPRRRARRRHQSASTAAVAATGASAVGRGTSAACVSATASSAARPRAAAASAASAASGASAGGDAVASATAVVRRARPRPAPRRARRSSAARAPRSAVGRRTARRGAASVGGSSDAVVGRRCRPRRRSDLWRARRRRQPPRRSVRAPGWLPGRLPPAPAPSRPACLRSSVWSLLVDIVPGNANGLGRRPGRVRNDRDVVRGRLARGPLPFARKWLGRVFSWAAFRSRESLAQRVLAATIGRPCPNCPTSPSSPRRFAPPSRAVRDRPRRPRRRSPCAARRPSSTALVGQRLRRASGGGASSCSLDFERDRGRRQPDADRPVPARRAGRQACRRRRPSSSASAPRDGRAAEAAPLDARRRLDAGRRAARSRCAIATRRRWARSTCCRRASPRTVPGLTDGELGPDADDPALDARRLATADPASTRAS